jgi:hypothetical protein
VAAVQQIHLVLIPFFRQSLLRLAAGVAGKALLLPLRLEVQAVVAALLVLQLIYI